MKNYLKPYGAVPNSNQMEHFKIEKKAFFHFGINTFTNLEWGDGSEAERDFNPVGCDTRQWIKSIKKAGFKLAIITAKHHDGFCLWPSKHTEHSIKNSAYKDGGGDLIREFVDACHEFDIKVGIYVSPWDRNSPYWGTNDYSAYYAKQLEELMTEYGRIDEVWWDGAGSRDTPYDWGMWADIIRRNQPSAVIFGSMGATPYVDMRWVGNEGGFAGDPCYAIVSTETLTVENTKLLNVGEPDGDLFRIAEVDTSIRPGWFFHEEQEDQVKSVPKLVHLWFDSVGSNANMLLNFPPDRTGHIREKDLTNAIEAHRIIEKMRSYDYALTASAEASVPCFDTHEAENVITPSEGCYCALTEKTGEIALSWKSKITFNAFEISEMIEYGHRIRGYRLEALVDGEYKTLFDGKCIGYKWADYFEPVTTDRVRLVIYDAKDIPLIRGISLYSFDTSIFDEEERIKSRENLAHGKSAKLIYNGKEVEIELGGIFPFNTVTFNGMGMWGYDIFVFNGSSYEYVCGSKSPGRNEIVNLGKTFNTSYKLKFAARTHGTLDPETLNIGVYEM